MRDERNNNKSLLPVLFSSSSRCSHFSFSHFLFSHSLLSSSPCYLLPVACCLFCNMYLTAPPAPTFFALYSLCNLLFPPVDQNVYSPVCLVACVLWSRIAIIANPFLFFPCLACFCLPFAGSSYPAAANMQQRIILFALLLSSHSLLMSSQRRLFSGKAVGEERKRRILKRIARKNKMNVHEIIHKVLYTRLKMH